MRLKPEDGIETTCIDKGKLMNAKHVGVFVVAVGLLWMLPAAARAQGPMVGVEPIMELLGQGMAVERTFPNQFDLLHAKSLTFEGTIAFTDPVNLTPVNVQIWFDWIDPRLPGQPQTSPPQTYQVGGQIVSVTQSYFIPFCPPQVSLHLQHDGPGQTAIRVQGTFIHECLVPEPGAAALLVLSAAGCFDFWRRRGFAPKCRLRQAD